MKKPINEQPRNSQNHSLSTENDSSSPPPHSQAHNWTMATQGLEEKKNACVVELTSHVAMKQFQLKG